MSEEEMKELLEELLLTYRQFYCADDPEKIARDEGPKCQDDADRAWVTLQSLFRDRLYSRNFLERDNYSDILGLLVQWARNNLPSGPGASNAFRYSTTASSLEECKNCLDQLTTNNVDGHQPAHWHFIRLIRYIEFFDTGSFF
jgi:hypothetical protein